MEKKIIEGLSRSDFGAMRNVTKKADNVTFSYALIQYLDGMCMIQSEQYYNWFMEGKVMPKTIKVLQDEIMTYEKDENGAPKIGPDGKKITKGTGKVGYSIIGAIGLEMAQNESSMRILSETMEFKEKTATVLAQTEFQMAIKALTAYSPSAAQKALIAMRIADDEDEENDEPTAGGDQNSGAVAGAGVEAGAAS